MILLEGGINKDGFVPVNFFSYAAFRKRFMKVLLDLLDKEINTVEFKNLKRTLYKNLKDGFYVYSPPSKFKSVDALIKYVTRYVSRPVMAESRILDYDGTYVTFWYQRHEDNKIVIEKIHDFEFISRIILHIPEKNQKYIRYYGCYHESTKIVTSKMKEIFRKFNQKSIELKKTITKWRLNIQFSFNIDPLKCPNCDTIMIYAESVNGEWRNIMEDDFIFNFNDTSSDIESICLNCGLEEKVPDFIYDEMGSRVKHKELKTNQKVSTIYCNRCGKFKTVSKYWLNHE